MERGSAGNEMAKPFIDQSLYSSHLGPVAVFPSVEVSLVLLLKTLSLDYSIRS